MTFLPILLFRNRRDGEEQGRGTYILLQHPHLYLPPSKGEEV